MNARIHTLNAGKSARNSTSALPQYADYVPFFSVIICTFNRSRLLVRALESLLEQRETDWEAIVVDDGSTDDTFEVVREFAEGNERIRYIYQQNRGSALAKNTGIASASGLFVTFLDSDDAYLPEHLALRKEIFVEYPHVEFLHGGAEIIGDRYVPDRNNPAKKIHLSKCVIGGTFVIRRETALRLGGFPPLRFADDNALYQKAVVAGITIAKNDAKTYVYDRTSPDSLCSIVAKEGLEGIARLVNTAKK